MKAMLTEDEVRDLLRRECVRAKAVKYWAEENGLSFSYVSEVLRGLKAPGAGLLKALGMRRVRMYEFSGGVVRKPVNDGEDANG